MAVFGVLPSVTPKVQSPMLVLEALPGGLSHGEAPPVLISLEASSVWGAAGVTSTDFFANSTRAELKFVVPIECLLGLSLCGLTFSMTGIEMSAMLSVPVSAAEGAASTQVWTLA